MAYLFEIQKNTYLLFLIFADDNKGSKKNIKIKTLIEKNKS